MTPNLEATHTWYEASMILGQIERSDHPTSLFADLRIMDVPLDGSQCTWEAICHAHREEVHEVVRQWSSSGKLPQCSEEALLLLRIRVATARSFLLGLMGCHTTLPGGLFPFPKGTPDKVARIFLSDWWDSCGWGFAGREFQTWARLSPQ